MIWNFRPIEKSALLGMGIFWIGTGVIAILKPVFYFRGAYVDFTGYNIPAGSVLIMIGMTYIGFFFKKARKQ